MYFYFNKKVFKNVRGDRSHIIPSLYRIKKLLKRNYIKFINKIYIFTINKSQN